MSALQVWSMLVRGCSLILTFAVAVLLARQLGASGFGVYAFVGALMTILGVPVELGMPMLVLRETARAHAQAAWRRLIGLWRWSSSISMGLAAASATITSLVVFGLRDGLDPTLQDTIFWGLLLMGLRAFTTLRGAAIRGLQHVLLGQIPELLVRPGLFLVLLFGLEAFVPLTADRAMALHATAAGVAFAVATVLRRRVKPRGSRDVVEPEYRHGSWLSSAVSLALLAGFSLISANTDLVMLGLLASSVEVGVYRVAGQGAALVAFGLYAVNLVASPTLARLHAQGDEPGLRRLIQGSTRLATMVGLPTALVLITWGRPLLVLFFGPEFGVGSTALAILAVGHMVNVGFGLVGMLLNMTGHERDTVRGVAIAAVVNVAANFALIPMFGMVGAALATLLSFAVWNVLLWRAVRRRLGLNTIGYSFR